MAKRHAARADGRKGLRARTERRLAWLLVVLAALVWPAAFLHEATTFHAVCPEHGELLDVELVHAADGHDHEEPGLRLSTAPEEEGEHELCPFVTLGQPAECAPEAPSQRAFGAEPAALVAVVSETGFPSIPLLCLAPKQSPPL